MDYERFKRMLTRKNYPDIITIEKWIVASFTVGNLSHEQFMDLMSTVASEKEATVQVKSAESEYCDIVKALIENPNFNQEAIKSIINTYKEAGLVSESEIFNLNFLIEDYYSLDTLKDKCILETKSNLTKFLEENPLFSYVKHKEGRFYRVTLDKQQQLTSTLLMYSGYQQAGIEFPLTWNDTGSVCEEWTYDQLFLLAAEMNGYVKPLVTLQQETEVAIKNAKTKEEVLSVNTNPYK